MLGHIKDSLTMLRLPLTLALVAGLAACATTGEGAGAGLEGAQTLAPTIDPQARREVAREDMLTQMSFWAGEYQAFPNDLEAAQRFSEALRLGGRADRAAQVAAEALSRFAEDRALLTTYGLAQLAAGRPQESVRPLALVAQAEPENWRVRNALGVALDQLGRFDQARLAYQEALRLHPEDAGVLTNLGVSYLMAGEPQQAEPILRQASALPSAPAQARQNLAIAVALQGRFDEAEQLSRADLPANAAAANVAYLRALLSDPRRWDDIRG